MMRISELAEKDGYAGSNGSWRSVSSIVRGVRVREIWHYRHLMLVFNVEDPADEGWLDFSIGHGSVSDQGGMNTLFGTLALPLYFSRQGGAKIVMLESNHDGTYRWPDKLTVANTIYS